jgi:Ca-activated chloride channel family protein
MAAPIPDAPMRREVAERVLETAAELESHIGSRDAAKARQSPPARGGVFSRMVDSLKGGSTPPSAQAAPEPLDQGLADPFHQAPAEEPVADLEGSFDDVVAERRAQKEDSGQDANALLSRQLASGLWAGTGAGPEPVRQARATAMALLELLRQGITSNHALHGAQVKKAVEALLTLASQLSGAPEVAELALGVAWLAAAGPRTRGRIAQAAQPLPGLSPHMGNEAALRQHVDALASR